MKNPKMTNALMLTALGLVALPLAAEAAPKKKKSKKPNVLFIMSDDHTSQAIGVYGSRLAPLNPTPTIDALAAEGVIFDNAFCNNSISTPSRASIMTGQYSHHNGVLTLDEKLKPEQQHLVREMQDLGYETAVIGKWHLGCEPQTDYYEVFTEAGEQGKYFNPLMASSENDKKKFPNNTVRYQGHSTDIVTDRALRWFEEIRDEEKPFFLMHHYKAPHDDFEFAPRYAEYLEDVEIPVPSTLLNREGFGSIGSRGFANAKDQVLGTSVSSRNVYRNYVDMYKIDLGDEEKNTIAAYNEYLKRYLRCVKGVDDNLARLFKYLKDNKLWDNTIIIYTGDQGMMLGEHDYQDKRWMYEEAFRMPYIMKVPGQKIKKGSHSDIVVQNVDYGPTILDLVSGGEETPDYMQGDSFAEVFRSGKEPEGWDNIAYYRYWMHLIHHNVPAHFGIRTKDYKLIFFYGRHYDTTRYGQASMVWLKDNSTRIAPTEESFELYDVKNDPEEKVNLANDPKYAKVLEEMKQMLITKKYELGDADANTPEIQAVINKHFKRNYR